MAEYFATLAAEDIGREILEKCEEYYRAMEQSGQLDVIMSSLRCYYGGPYNSTGGNTKYVSRSGKYGQLRKMRVNHVRNLGLHILQLATSQRPTPQPVPINTDAQSQEAVALAKGVLDYYSRFKRVDRILRSAAERAIVTGEGYVDVSWDDSLGEPVGEDDTGKRINDGDLKIDVFSALEVVREMRPGSKGIGDWVVLIRPENRWDMIAKYVGGEAKEEDSEDPVSSGLSDLRKALEGAPKINVDGKYRERRPWGAVLSTTVQTSEDCIAVFEFRHAKTPACPGGRLVKMTEDGVVFMSGELPFDDIGVRKLSAGEMMDTPFSYGPLFDLLGIQEIIDALYSAVASNQMTFATQLIWALKSADFDYRQLSHGITLLEGNDPNAKPEALNLTSTPAEVFNFIKQLEGAMETISGVNATVRGNPEYSLKSGSALAAIQQQAVQFSSTLQQQYAHLVEDVYTDMLSLLEDHANSPRQIVIIGKFNRPYIQDFQSADIAGIKRVVVDAGPAVAQTAAFRQDVARDLLQNGLIKRPEEYIAVVNTGRLEPLIEGENAELILIQKENEYLKEGKPVHALPIDKHLLHIQEHRCAAADPESREDPLRVQALSDHIMEHVGFLADPMFAPLMLVLGETPMSMAMQMPQENGPQRGPDQKKEAEGIPPGNTPEPTEPQNQPPSQPDQPEMPEPAQPPAGMQ